MAGLGSPGPYPGTGTYTYKTLLRPATLRWAACGQA
jgi:hypothetical protein